MKKPIPILLALALTLGLAACGAASPGGEAPEATVHPAEGPAVTGRILDNDGTALLLAGLAQPYDSLYTVSLSALEEAGLYTEDLRPGERVELAFDGTVQETLPGQIGNVTGVTVIEDGRDRLYQLYLDALEDLWAADPALHDGITTLGFDLTSTRLTPAERQGVETLFARAHGNPAVVEGTRQELTDAGYINGEDLYWPDGVLLSVTEKGDEADRVVFDAQIWRSGLGAYLFCDCTSRKLIGGDWAPYVVGSEAIS